MRSSVWWGTEIACFLGEVAISSLSWAIYFLLHHRNKRLRKASPSLSFKKKNIELCNFAKTQTSLLIRSKVAFSIKAKKEKMILILNLKLKQGERQIDEIEDSERLVI